MPRSMISCALLVLTLLALTAPAAGAAENDGFLYGSVVTDKSDTLVGFLRWEDEEAFWDDIFHSQQRDVPWDDYADLKRLHREREQAYYKTHGLLDRIAYALENRHPDSDIARPFAVRFGDIAAILIDANDDVSVELGDGSSHALRGRSQDTRQDIEVHRDGAAAEVLDWDDLREIRFAQAPPEAVPYAGRLYGKVQSTAGDFEGFIQWDRSECTTGDVLDSDQEDLAMGTIKTLRRIPGGDTEAVLADGRTLTLSGSNDVSNGQRGVVVQTADRWRVTIPWERFRLVEFAAGHGSGPGRGAYADDGPLVGVVTTTDGRVLTGRLVYDLDEARWGDLLNGETTDELDWDIPFGAIASIAPEGMESCLVTLRDGRQLTLVGTNDTGKDHAGVLVWETPDAAPGHLMWSEIRRIDLRR